MEEEDELMQKAYDLGFRYEAERGSCPQCVLAAVRETINGVDTETIRAADALAGGSALSTEGTCGALAGGLLALGACAGRSYASFGKGEKRRSIFKHAQTLYDRFVAAYGSPLCKEVQRNLLGRSFNLREREGYTAFEKAGGHEDKCPGVVGNVARWTVEILRREIQPH